MSFSNTCIRRPVFAVVMTLLLILFGVLSFFRLPVREYPDIKPPIISVRTVYPGASASVIESDVTTPLEDSLSGIQGLRTMSSASREEVSMIALEFEIARDLDGATNDVRDGFQIRSFPLLGILEPFVERLPPRTRNHVDRRFQRQSFELSYPTSPTVHQITAGHDSRGIDDISRR